MDSILRDAAARGARYLEELEMRSVAPSVEALGRLSELGGSMPDGPSDPADVLALLDEVGSPATLATAGRRFFGFVICGVLPAALAASWLGSAWNQNAALVAASPVSAALEETALRWLLDVLDLPSSCGGAFVTGATMANFTALAAARHAVLGREGWDVESDGLFGAPPVTVVVGEEAHPTLRKALGMLGFGRNRVTVVPADEQGRMRPDALPKLSGPTIICMQSGNINTGAMDPAAEICGVARSAGAWVHVDGAFGMWAAVAPERAHLVAGVPDADSWATDAHKWLNVPYDSGLAFVREPRTPSRGHGPERLVSAIRRPTGAVRVYAGAFATRPRHRSVGCASVAWARRLSRPHRANVRIRHTLRGGSPVCGLCRPQRCRAQSGARVVW